MCFFFAQKYHTSMKYVGPVRIELGFRTVFNILGDVYKRQRLGCYEVTLNVWSGNTSAEKFYEKMGQMCIRDSTK